MPYASGYAASALGERLLGQADRLRAEQAAREAQKQNDERYRLGLAIQGVQEGTAPTRTRQIARNIPPPGDFALPPLIPEPGKTELAGARGMVQTPDFGGMAPPSIAEPDPAFEQLTPDYFRQTPGYAERKAADAEAMRYMAEVPQAIDALRSGTGDIGVPAATLDRAGLSPKDYIPEPTEVPAWKREGDYYAGLRGPNGERYGPKGQLLTTSSGPKQPDPADVRQWYDQLKDSYSYWTKDAAGQDVERPSLDHQTMLDLATQIASGETVALPPTPDRSGGATYSGGRALTSSLMYNPSQMPTGMRYPERKLPLPSRRAAMTVPEPTGGTMGTNRAMPAAAATEQQTLSDSDVKQLQGMLGGMPRSEAERILREEGATDEQIARVLGSG